MNSKTNTNLNVNKNGNKKDKENEKTKIKEINQKQIKKEKQKQKQNKKINQNKLNNAKDFMKKKIYNNQLYEKNIFTLIFKNTISAFILFSVFNLLNLIPQLFIHFSPNINVSISFFQDIFILVQGISAVGILVTMGSSSLYSKYFVKKQGSKANKVVSTSFLLTIVLSLIYILLIYIFKNPIFNFLNIPESFNQILTFTLFGLLFSNIFVNILLVYLILFLYSNRNRTTIFLSLKVLAFYALLTFLGSFFGIMPTIFMFFLSGALSTIYVLSLYIPLKEIREKKSKKNKEINKENENKNEIKINNLEIKDIKLSQTEYDEYQDEINRKTYMQIDEFILDKKTSIDIIKNGFPYFVLNIASILVSLLTLSTLIIGVDINILTAFSVSFSILNLIRTASFSVNNALGVFMNFNLEKRNFERVKQGIKNSFLINLIITIVISLIVYVFKDKFTSIYSSSENIHMFASGLLPNFLILFPFASFLIILSGISMSLKKRALAIFLSLFKDIFVFLPLMYFGSKNFNLDTFKLIPLITDLIVIAFSIIIYYIFIRRIDYVKSK